MATAYAHEATRKATPYKRRSSEVTEHRHRSSELHEAGRMSLHETGRVKKQNHLCVLRSLPASAVKLRKEA